MKFFVTAMRLVSALVLLFFPVLLPAQQSAVPVPSLPTIAAKAYVLLDFNSGQFLASHSPSERVEPASLTKLMTAYLAFAALRQKTLRPEQHVPVSAHAWKAQGSRMFIEPHKPVTVDELIRGMIVQSGNDACIALAEAIAGSEDVFAQMMTREAQRLGMKNTNFVNSTGLPHPQHYSTAHDLALLAAAIVATALPVAAAGAAEEGRPEANSSDRRHCTQVTVRAGSRMSGRRVCRTAAEWREALGPDWRQLLAGYRGVEEDYESLTTRATPFNGVAGQQGMSPAAARAGRGPR